jgi:hypothetical protein
MAAAQRQWTSPAARRTRQPRRPVHDPARLLQLAARARRQPPHRRGRGQRPPRLLRRAPPRRRGQPAASPPQRSPPPQELTSRVRTSEVAETKRRLGLGFPTEGARRRRPRHQHDLRRPRHHPPRPHGRARPAQDRRRVHPGDQPRRPRPRPRPGLVVTLLNVHRPRDRSHYERFAAWHESFYRAVEATSVTPFSPPARARGLAGVTVALAATSSPH